MDTIREYAKRALAALGTHLKNLAGEFDPVNLAVWVIALAVLFVFFFFM